MTGDDTDEINRLFAEALGSIETISHYECRDCGLVFDSGREARRHMFGEHDDPLGIKTVRESDLDE